MRSSEHVRRTAAAEAGGSRLGVALAWLAVWLLRLAAALLLVAPLLLLAWLFL
jgi:hypothetical protein